MYVAVAVPVVVVVVVVALLSALTAHTKSKKNGKRKREKKERKNAAADSNTRTQLYYDQNVCKKAKQKSTKRWCREEAGMMQEGRKEGKKSYTRK